MTKLTRTERPVSFPFDWIRPGEIVFCHRCGCTESVHFVENPIPCPRCSPDIKARLAKPTSIIARIWAWIKPSTSTVRWKAVRKLAKKRRISGLPALFWLDD